MHVRNSFFFFSCIVHTSQDKDEKEEEEEEVKTGSLNRRLMTSHRIRGLFGEDLGLFLSSSILVRDEVSVCIYNQEEEHIVKTKKRSLI